MNTSKRRLMLLAGLLNEAVLGGASNGLRYPGFTGKKNEIEVQIDAFKEEEKEEPLEESLSALEAGKLYKVNMLDAKIDLAGIAFDLAEEIQSMNIPKNADRKTERMTKQRLANIYSLLKKLKHLAT